MPNPYNAENPSSSFTRITVKLDALQERANNDDVFRLKKNPWGYYLEPKVMKSVTMPDLNGRFIYVIKFHKPDIIYCGRTFAMLNEFFAKGKDGIEAQKFSTKHGIEGHTSLTKRKDVLFAGELLFRDRQLVSWSNESGHYQPRAELRRTNLLEHIKEMLPEHLFDEHSFENDSTKNSSVASSRPRSRMGDFSSGESNGSYRWSAPNSASSSRSASPIPN